MNEERGPTTLKEAALAEIFGDVLHLIERTEKLYERIPIANDEAVRQFNTALGDASTRVEQLVEKHTATTVGAADEIHRVTKEVVKLRSEFIALADRALENYRTSVYSGIENRWKKRFAFIAAITLVCVMTVSFGGGVLMGMHMGPTLLSKFSLSGITK